MDRSTAFPILSVPPHVVEPEHEAKSATRTGWIHEHSGDAVSIFTLGVPDEDWGGVVLAVASGQGRSASPGLASAAAVEAFEVELTRSADYLEFRSHAWQEPIAQALVSAFNHAGAAVRALSEGPGVEPPQGVALAAAAVLGNWLCVVHAGDCRVYHLTKAGLEEMTADQGRPEAAVKGTERPGQALGPEPLVTTEVRFARLNTGDLVLVCGAALGRNLDLDALVPLLRAQRPVADIAENLVAAVATAGGADDQSVCLLRVGRLPKRLPAPTARLDDQLAAAVAGSWRSRRFGVLLGVLALAVVLIGGWWLRRAAARAEGPMAVLQPVPPQPTRTETPALPPVESAVPAPVPTEVTAATRDPQGRAASPEPTRGEPTGRPEHQPTSPPPRQLASLPRVSKGSGAPEPAKVADKPVRDSLIAGSETEAAAREEQARRATAEREARERRAEQARADQEAQGRRAAQVRADQEIAAMAVAAERAREAGKNALNGWMTGLVAAVNAGNGDAPVLAAGPARFAAFVRKNQPRLSDAKLLTVAVNEETGEASAEWVAKWRTEFGTVTSRSMKATATVVPDGAGWRLVNWRIAEGLP